MPTALRLIEASMPEQFAQSLLASLEPVPIVERWSIRDDDSRLTLRLLVPAESVEAVFDAIAGHGLPEGTFRVILFSVEATLPRVEPEQADQASQAAAEQAGDPRQRGRISRDELLSELAPGTRVTAIYLVMVLLSAVVASVGLLQDSVAVIIGAMVIAPLLIPNMALALATTMGDLNMARQALWTNTAGVTVAFAFALLLGVLVPVDSSVSEVADRTRVSMGDLAVGLAAGAAGAVSVTTGVPAMLIGVMVAVALLPPLVATGLLAGNGEWVLASRAALLLAINIVCVNLAAVGTFLAQGIRPRTWWEADRARRATRTALALWIAVLLGLIALVWIAQQR